MSTSTDRPTAMLPYELDEYGHIADAGKHVERLSARISVLQEQADGDTSAQDYDELWRIIHQPYWTTPVQLVLVEALLEAQEQAVRQSVVLRKALLAGATGIAEEAAGRVAVQRGSAES